MSSIQTVVDKVQKLLALTTSSNAGEAANAARAANKLIDQYRLSQADLEVSGQAEEPLEEDEGHIYQTGKITLWKHTLVSELAKHYGLSYWMKCTYPTGRKVTAFKLVGRKSDIAVAKYMFSWLLLECQRLSDLYVKGEGRVRIASYCLGFVNGVTEQLANSRAEVKKEASNNAIVKLDNRKSEAEAFMYSLHSNLKTVKGKSSTHLDSDAYNSGLISGKEIHLGQSLTTGAPKLLGS